VLGRGQPQVHTHESIVLIVVPSMRAAFVIPWRRVEAFDVVSDADVGALVRCWAGSVSLPH
jgi:hypothetical protein